MYTSATLSLAALERLVHTFSVRGLAGLWVYAVEIDEIDSRYLPDDALPADWNRKPVPPDWHEAPPKATQRIGDAWVAGGASLALRVPSAVLPSEATYLLNPAHPAFDPARVGAPQRFAFDERIASLVRAVERGAKDR